ncbi:DsbA family protein [Antarctobacter heliothermus]|uniref:DSBA-like thioredoxin domain-containing protein n=1 Tax=Antarctobacter heliothermus TaxID=74033 RepID=A0A239F2C7_9RHOB|nr:DSBA-like thioredoxin domain-containing protein [Antarctobacter heliothermus]
MKEGWGVAYTVDTYRRWFQDGQEAGSEPNLSDSLHAVGQDPAEVLVRARSEEIGQALDRQTATAQNIGVFGSPSFVVGREVFWGDDRLDDAAGWARRNG